MDSQRKGRRLSRSKSGKERWKTSLPSLNLDPIILVIIMSISVKNRYTNAEKG
ncbi:hypothetical protein ACFYKT_18120 [Cytobacillus sp. FJAT-53684]|uniref:Uncharacterized protein n=1 Tax=Cytobacillus mangrovibacter TaxID=3299024 RepID=A0ABW6K3T4_9BACI